MGCALFESNIDLTCYPQYNPHTIPNDNGPLKLIWTPFWTMTELKAQQYTIRTLMHPSFKWYNAELSTP